MQYRLDHPELSLRKAAEKLGIRESALKAWMKAAKEHKGSVLTRGSGNYASMKQKRLPDYSVNYETQKMRSEC